jgi:hypothetical protein
VQFQTSRSATMSTEGMGDGKSESHAA